MNLILILALVVIMGFITTGTPIWIAFALTLGIFFWKLFEEVL